MLFRTGKQFIRQGDRVALLGPNGVGKTRLVEMIRAAVNDPETTHAGIKATTSLVLGYSDQALATLRDADTPIDTIVRRFEVGDQRARALLAGAGVAIDMQTRRIGQLSGGQRARLNALALRLTNPNFYLLDEPTNHLDIEGQEALESELIAHQASCLLVSHDRTFVRAVGNRFWVIERKRLLEVEGPGGVFCGRGQSAVIEYGSRRPTVAHPIAAGREPRCARHVSWQSARQRAGRRFLREFRNSFGGRIVTGVSSRWATEPDVRVDSDQADSDQAPRPS